MTLALSSEQHSSQSVPGLAEEPSHFLFSLIASPIWAARGSPEDTCFLACCSQSLDPGLVLNGCEWGEGQAYLLRDRDHQDPIISVPACEFPSEAGLGSQTFFLVKVTSVHFTKKGVHGEWEKEDFEDELKSKLGEKETHTELKKEKVVFSLEKSCVLRRLAPVFYFTYFFSTCILEDYPGCIHK